MFSRLLNVFPDNFTMKFAFFHQAKIISGPKILKVADKKAPSPKASNFHR
jgi:hypothetical protein